ncbi:MAG: dipeptidase [Planctomycetota bacterium]|jgi:membrane dipeptidase
MFFKRLSSLSLVALLMIFGGCLQQPITEHQIISRAKAIHKKALTLDTHVDIPGAQYATEAIDPGIDNPKLKCDLVKMNKGGVDGVFLAVFVAQKKRDAEGYKNAYESAMAKFEAINRLTEKMYPQRCELATSPEDVERIAKTSKKVIMIGVENGFAIGKDVSNVERFYNLGVRYITLSHNGHNDICDSCNPAKKLGDKETEHDGLSEFGKKVVAEMNRLGIMADVSHISVKSFHDLIEVSKAPIIASHSGCRALADHPRNLNDEQLKALARNRGVIQIVAVGGFLKLGSPPPADVETYVDHIDHAVKVAGIEHVGIGSDFDGGGGVPGFNDHSQALNVTIELVRRGYSEADILKIWGANLLRVWREVEKVAQELQKGSKNGRVGN